MPKDVGHLTEIDTNILLKQLQSRSKLPRRLEGKLTRYFINVAIFCKNISYLTLTVNIQTDGQSTLTEGGPVNLEPCFMHNLEHPCVEFIRGYRRVLGIDSKNL
ncbi:Hypothetical predicted protein [Octopus vulgaris]|uniref:Uncharacterized protein n=1 Tax=Octopus vulgaris TaxID=6645 RepID=A0AA36FMB4_OCTVU|nr:Hypothetical predicted protein [Octopus vulgaris]